MDTISVREAAVRSLEDEIKPHVNRVSWVVERCVWVVMAVILLVALLGLAGGGPLSRTGISREAAGGEIHVDYARFTRYHAPNQLNVSVLTPGASGDELQLRLSPGLSNQIDDVSFDPPPDSVTFGPDGALYTWPVQDWSQPVELALEYRTDEWPRIAGAVVVTAGDSAPEQLNLTQIVLP